MATTDPEDWPDVEGALRTYLRLNTDIQSVVGSRVFFGVPRNSENAFPCIMLTRIGGGQQGGDAPMDQPMIQFDCYAKTAEEGGGRLQATQVAQALRKALSTIRGRTRLDANTVGWDPRVTGQVFSPLPGDDRPRILLTCVMTAAFSASG